MKLLYNYYKLLPVAIVTCIICFISCTKFPNNPPIMEEYTELLDTAIKRKVLIVAIDGLVGSQVKLYQPTNIKRLIQNAKYSFETKADDNTNPYASWTTLLTGYKSNNHKITKESFMVDINMDKEHAGYDLNRSIMYRLERANSKLRTASVVQNPTMNAMMLADADSNSVANTDEVATERMLDLLNFDKTDVLLGQYKGLVNAGKEGGFVISNPKYKSELDQIDNYIGQLVNAIENRSTYNQEKWLIIICSPHGGTPSGTYGGSTQDEINTFSLYYNKSFKPLEIRAEAMAYMHANGYFVGNYQPLDDTIGNKVRIISTEGVRAQSPTGATSNVFNASTHSSKSITYEFKLNILSEGYWRTNDDYRYTTLLGKDIDDKVSTKGWSFSTGSLGENMLLFQNGIDSTGITFVRTRNKWCHYAFIFKEVSISKTLVEIIEDGELIASKVIDMGLADFENQDPLTIGFTSLSKLYSIPNFQISNLRVWKRALNQNEVKDLACINDIETSNIIYADLLAFYKYFTSDKKWVNIKDNSAPHLILTGNATSKIVPFNSLCGLDPKGVYSQTVDMLPQVFYWLRLELSGDNKLEGKEFLNTYLDEFWRD